MPDPRRSTLAVVPAPGIILVTALSLLVGLAAIEFTLRAGEPPCTASITDTQAPCAGP